MDRTIHILPISQTLFKRLPPLPPTLLYQPHIHFQSISEYPSCTCIEFSCLVHHANCLGLDNRAHVLLIRRFFCVSRVFLCCFVFGFVDLQACRGWSSSSHHVAFQLKPLPGWCTYVSVLLQHPSLAVSYHLHVWRFKFEPEMLLALCRHSFQHVFSSRFS